MSMREWALSYASAGIPVLALHTVVDGPTGLVCACGDGPACIRSPGKHPHPLSQHGALSATTDLGVIGTWPEDGYNLGIAPAASFATLDVDNEAIAKQLLESGALDGQIAVRTGRGWGVHVYFHASALDKAMSDLVLESGERVGEIRSAGAYLVAPPSRHQTGRLYEWIGSPLQYAMPTFLAASPSVDIFTAASGFLAASGIAVKPLKAYSVVPLEGGIEPIEFPFDLPKKGTSKIRKLLEGNPLAADRSDSLFFLACECYRVAKDLGENILPIEVAGVVKRADRVHYKKFSNRPEQVGDEQYWNIANRANDEIQTEALASAFNIPPGTPIATPTTRLRTYNWDEVHSEFQYLGGKNPLRICNFEPKIMEVRAIWRGDDLELQREWTVRIRKPGNPDIELQLTQEQYHDTRALNKALSVLPPSYIIERRMIEILKVGMQHYSGIVPEHKIYGITGWLPDRDAFLVPDWPGAVTATGYDEEITYTDKGSAPLLREDTFREAIEWLLHFPPSRYCVPILMQTLASNLLSVGLPYRTFLHVRGKTNTFKTTFCQQMMTIYGVPALDTKTTMISWSGATINAIRMQLSKYRDLPVLIDDYKNGTVRLQDVVSFIQAVGDQQGRERLTRDARAASSHSPRGLPVSTGEEVWEGSQSALSRTMIVPWEGWTDRETMAVRSEQVRDGVLSAIGVLWLRFLAGRGKVALRAYLDEAIPQALPIVSSFTGTSTPRVTAGVASLVAVSGLFVELVKVHAPELVEEVRQYIKFGWLGAFTAASTQIEQGIEFSPFSQLSAEIREHIDAGDVMLRGRRNRSEVYGDPFGTVVGWFEGGEAYLSEHVTFGWVLKERARKRQELGLSWSSVIQDAITSFNGRMGQLRIREADSGAGTRTRCLIVPLDDLMRDSVFGNAK